ncbi:MAG TPA: hypothetical protein VGB03_00125 [Acidimicrobiales bacterium]
MRTGSRVGWAVVVALVALALLPSAASACSCAGFDNPRAALASATAAFVGVLDRVEGDGLSGGDTEFHYRVEHAVKGEIGEKIVVHSRGDGGSCGLEGHPGDREAMFLTKDGKGRWLGSLCSTIHPERLLAASRPLPAPNGQGPPVLVLGAGLGEHRLLSLDSAGRTLAYGGGDQLASEVVALDMCPGSRRVVEALSAKAEGPLRPLLAVRDVDGLAVERSVAAREVVPEGSGDSRVQAVQCRDPSASELDVADRGGVRSHLYRMSGGRSRTVWQGPAAQIRLSDDSNAALAVYVDRIERIDLRTGVSAVIHRAQSFGEAHLTPDGSRLALVTAKSYRADMLLVLDARTGVVQATHQLGPDVDHVQAEWVTDDVLALSDLRGTLSFFDARLRALSRVDGWSAYRLFGAAGRAYGAPYAGGPLLEASTESKGVRRIAVPDGATAALIAVPPPTKGQARAFTTTTAAMATTLPTTSGPAPQPAPSEGLPLPPLAPASSSRPWMPAGVAFALLGSVILAVALRRPRAILPATTKVR